MAPAALRPAEPRRRLRPRRAGDRRASSPGNVLHRPSGVGAGRPDGEALWLAHRRRLLAALGRLRAGVPRAPAGRTRPVRALRFLVLLLFVVGFFVAGSERLDRLGEAFRGGESAAATVARIDAWVTPPAYTGRPPIFLTGDAAKPAGTEYSVPAGSVVTVRTGGTHDLDVVATGAAGEIKIAPSAVAKASHAMAPTRRSSIR